MLGFPQLLLPTGRFWTFNDYRFSGKIIWTTLLEFTVAIFTAKYWIKKWFYLRTINLKLLNANEGYSTNNCDSFKFAISVRGCHCGYSPWKPNSPATPSPLTDACTMVMEAKISIETSVQFYQNTWHQMPEDSNLHNHRELQTSSTRSKWSKICTPSVTTIFHILLFQMLATSFGLIRPSSGQYF